MARTIGLSQDAETRLFDTLTSHRCESMRDVARYLGVPLHIAQMWITRQRKAAAAGASWWTIPHAARGRGQHLFRVVEVGSTEVLTSTDRDLVTQGRASSMKAISQEARNLATACRIMGNAEYLPVPLRAKCLAQAIVLDQAIAMMDAVVAELQAFPQLTLAA